jgi:hypothetical protein
LCLDNQDENVRFDYVKKKPTGPGRKSRKNKNMLINIEEVRNSLNEKANLAAEEAYDDLHLSLLKREETYEEFVARNEGQNKICDWFYDGSIDTAVRTHFEIVEQDDNEFVKFDGTEAELNQEIEELAEQMASTIDDDNSVTERLMQSPDGVALAVRELIIAKEIYSDDELDAAVKEVVDFAKREKLTDAEEAYAGAYAEALRELCEYAHELGACVDGRVGKKRFFSRSWEIYFADFVWILGKNRRELAMAEIDRISHRDQSVLRDSFLLDSPDDTVPFRTGGLDDTDESKL